MSTARADALGNPASTPSASLAERLRSESMTNGDTDIRWQAADLIERLQADLREIDARLADFREDTGTPDSDTARQITRAAILYASGITPTDGEDGGAT